MAAEHRENGDVIFLARAPGQVAEQPASSGIIAQRGARSGNPKFDPITGKFAGGKIKDNPLINENPVPVTRSGIPQGVTQEEWERRLDTVRDAAREMDSMEEGDAREFLKGRVNDLSKIDLAIFITDVRAQRLDDLTDIFDAQLRSKIEGMRRARRHVRMAAPKGWVKRVFGSLEDAEMDRMLTRLSARGYENEDLNKYVISRIRDETRRTELESRYKGKKPKKANLDDWIGTRPSKDDFIGMEENKSKKPVVTDPAVYAADIIKALIDTLPQQPTAIELAEAVGQVVSQIPPPVVNVTPNIHVDAPKPVRQVIRRNDQTGLIETVDPEEV